MLAQGSLFDLAVGWSGIIASAVAVLAVVVGFWVSSVAYQVLAMTSRRRRWVGQAVRGAGLCRSRSRFLARSWRLLSGRVRTGEARISDELTWLTDLGPTRQAEAGLSPAHLVPVPFTFSSQLPAAGYSAALTRLAAAYDAYAVSLRRRWLLRSAAGPLIGLEYECARATAGLLRRWASFEPMAAPGDPDKLRDRLVELAPGAQPRRVRLVAWPDMVAARATPLFASVGVSFQPYRVTIDAGGTSDFRSAQREVRKVASPGGRPMVSPLAFDGVLTRWHGPGCRMEMDRITGRQKLHLCLSETTFFAWQATQRPESAAKAGDDALCSRLLSLNLLAIDTEDVVVLVQRSDYVVYPGQYAGTVTGNCELASREGLDADFDASGLPDPLAALTREAREELGLELSPERDQFAALGVIEYAGEAEIGSRALIATARLRGRAADFRVERLDPDPVEGLWELGDQFMTVDMGATLRDRRTGRAFVNWLRGGPELAPQGAGSLLLLLVARLELAQCQAARARGARTPAWTTADLAAWLDEPAPDRPVSPGGFVQFHPLWR